MGGSGGNRKEFKHSYRPHLGNTMELKIVRKYRFLLLGIHYFYNLLFSHTVKIFPTWKSSLTKHSSWKDKHLDYFFFNRKLNELQVIPTSCMKGLEKSHNDFKDCSHWENINIFWCLYIYSGSKHCGVKSKGKKV